MPREKQENTAQTTNQNLLGQILLRRGQIRRYQLEFALRLQHNYRLQSKNFRLGEILEKHRATSHSSLSEALSRQENLSGESVSQILKTIEDHPQEEEVTKLLPSKKS